MNLLLALLLLSAAAPAGAQAIVYADANNGVSLSTGTFLDLCVSSGPRGCGTIAAGLGRSGRVGINNQNPQTELDVAGTITATTVAQTTGTFSSCLKQPANGSNFEACNNYVSVGAVTTQTSSASFKGAVCVDCDGSGDKLGIGTASPGSKFEVIGSTNPTDSNATIARFIQGTTAADRGIAILGENNASAKIQSVNQAGTYAGNLVLQPYSGNVGIGVTPTKPLMVASSGGDNVYLMGRDNGTTDEASMTFRNFENNQTHGTITGASGGLTVEGAATSGLFLQSANGNNATLQAVGDNRVDIKVNSANAAVFSSAVANLYVAGTLKQTLDADEAAIFNPLTISGSTLTVRSTTAGSIFHLHGMTDTSSKLISFTNNDTGHDPSNDGGYVGISTEERVVLANREAGGDIFISPGANGKVGINEEIPVATLEVATNTARQKFSSVNLLDDGTYAIETHFGARGILTIQSNVTTFGCIVQIQGASNAVVEIADPGDSCRTADTDAFIDVIADGDGTYTLKNRLGSAAIFAIQFVGFE